MATPSTPLSPKVAPSSHTLQARVVTLEKTVEELRTRIARLEADQERRLPLSTWLQSKIATVYTLYSWYSMEIIPMN